MSSIYGRQDRDLLDPHHYSIPITVYTNKIVLKRLFRMALGSDSAIHILLVGPPASAKSMFLTALMELKNSLMVLIPPRPGSLIMF